MLTFLKPNLLYILIAAILFLETSNKIKNLIYHKQIKLKKAILEKNRDKKQELLFTSCRYLDGEKFKLTK